jgi:2-polyprenyl-3-methyl-5-hydroxy-6-metoxy-1,4-benzoquinol methylase
MSHRVKKRVLLISDSWIWEIKMADIAHAVLERSGMEVLRLEWNHKHYVPSSPHSDMSNLHMALFDDGVVDSAPCLSGKEYRALCGDDMDFSKITMKDDWIDGWNENEDHLDPESPAARHLRGGAWRFESLLHAVRPDVVMIRQGCDPFSLVMLSKALKAGIPAFLMESGFLPGHVYFELRGQHFYRDFCRIDAIYGNGPPDVDMDAAQAALHTLKDDILNRNISKYDQQFDKAETEFLEAFCARFHGKVLFFPEQMPLDSNVFSSLRDIGADNLQAICGKIIDALPEDVGLVCKRHPRAAGSLFAGFSQKSNVLRLERLSIAEIFKRVGAVVTLTSNVGFEAAVCGLPVLSLGGSIYSRKGLTLDWNGRDSLTPYLSGIFGYRAEERNVAAFLYTLKKEVLFSPEAPPDDFERLIGGDGCTPEPDARAPFWKEGAGAYSRYGRLKARYAALAEENGSYREIMGKLGRPARDSRERSLSGREREQCFQLGRQNMAEMTRYALAAMFLPKNGRILDAGCGIGRGTAFLAAQCRSEITAFDERNEAIDYAAIMSAAPHITYCAASAGAFSEKLQEDTGGRYELITAFNILERVYAPEKFIDALKETMSENAVLAGSVRNREYCSDDDDPLSIHRYDVPSLKEVLNIRPGEYVRYVHQSAETIGNAGHDGDHIIFIITKNEDKLEYIEKILPFTYHRADYAGRLYFPPAFFTAPGTCQPTINGIPVAWTNRPGLIFYGPYQVVPAGCWEVKFLFESSQAVSGKEIEKDCNITLDIVGRQGQVSYFRKTFFFQELSLPATTKIRVDYPEEQLEFRAYRNNTQKCDTVPCSPHFVFKGILLDRLPDVFSDIIPSPESSRQDSPCQCEAEKQLEDIYRSRSWRITKPLRFISGILRGGYKSTPAVLKRKIKPAVVKIIHICRRHRLLNGSALYCLEFFPRLKARLRTMETGQAYTSATVNEMSSWNRYIYTELKKVCVRIYADGGY